MTGEQVSEPLASAASCAEASKIIDAEGEVEWVDRAPVSFDHEVAAGCAEFAEHYREIAAERFDDDPDLTSRIAPREPGDF